MLLDLLQPTADGVLPALDGGLKGRDRIGEGAACLVGGRLRLRCRALCLLDGTLGGLEEAPAGEMQDFVVVLIDIDDAGAAQGPAPGTFGHAVGLAAAIR